jgi:hypothetical protein
MLAIIKGKIQVQYLYCRSKDQSEDFVEAGFDQVLIDFVYETSDF